VPTPATIQAGAGLPIRSRSCRISAARFDTVAVDRTTEVVQVVHVVAAGVGGKLLRPLVHGQRRIDGAPAPAVLLDPGELRLGRPERDDRRALFANPVGAALLGNPDADDMRAHAEAVANVLIDGITVTPP
jgi:hypothetical protein